MNSGRFDSLARSAATASRRSMLRALAGAALGLAAARLGPAAAAKKAGAGRRRRKRPPFNRYGCLNVGQKCRGNGALCCSGLCSGRKPKKGTPDRSRCAAHHTGGCTPQGSICAGGMASCGDGGALRFCLTTTGGAGFCFDMGVFNQGSGRCYPCRKDADCQAAGFGAGSACVLYAGASCSDRCVGVNGSSGTACLPPAV